MTRILLAIVAILGATVAALVVPLETARAAVVTECGQLTGYTAPDPLGPTDGSLQLGLLDPWTVLADATVSAAAAAVLPGFVNSGPTCLQLDVDDDGRVTAVDFAPVGTISGGVDFDTGSGFYLFADRLIVPDFITDTYPGLDALFVTSYQAGTTVTATFTVDTTTGAFTSVDGSAAFCGMGSVTEDGDGQVGAAIIRAEVLDATDLEALAGAGTNETCATVRTTGTIGGQGDLTLETDVQIDVAAPGVTITPPPTTTVMPASDPSATTSIPAWLALVGVASAILVLVTRPDRHRR